jgi:hypothetical protein
MKSKVPSKPTKVNGKPTLQSIYKPLYKKVDRRTPPTNVQNKKSRPEVPSSAVPKTRAKNNPDSSTAKFERIVDENLEKTKGKRSKNKELVSSKLIVITLLIAIVIGSVVFLLL